MLEVERAGKKEWKYGPYIRASPGPSPLTDFIRLPNSTEMRGQDPEDVPGQWNLLSGTPLTVPDFSYDWHVSYQSASPARLSFIEKPFALESWGFQANSGDYAQEHDWRDLYSTWLCRNTTTTASADDARCLPGGIIRPSIPAHRERRRRLHLEAFRLSRNSVGDFGPR